MIGNKMGNKSAYWGPDIHIYKRELTLRLCTRGGESQEPRKRDAL